MLFCCVHAKSFQLHPTLSDPMDCTCQAPLSMGFSRQEYWSGLPFPSPGDLPDPGIKPASLKSPTLAGGFFTTTHLGSTFRILFHTSFIVLFFSFRFLHFYSLYLYLSCSCFKAVILLLRSIRILLKPVNHNWHLPWALPIYIYKGLNHGPLQLLTFHTP